jgi:hypothetical protein
MWFRSNAKSRLPKTFRLSKDCVTLAIRPTLAICEWCEIRSTVNGGVGGVVPRALATRMAPLCGLSRRREQGPQPAYFHYSAVLLSHGARATSLGCVWNGAHIAAIGGKAGILRSWPVVVPTFGRFAVFGASGSAGWCGCAAGGGAASILMPSPSIRGRGAFCAAATPVLGLPSKQTPALIQVPQHLPWRSCIVAVFFDDCRNLCPSKMNVQRRACGFGSNICPGRRSTVGSQRAEESYMLALCLTPDISSLGA